MSTIDQQLQQQLEQDGFCLFPNYIPRSMLDEMRRRCDELWEDEGENAGSEFRQEAGTRRLANLVDKGEVFERMVVMPQILGGVRAVLGPRFKLSSLNARSANPYSDSSQPLHADMGAVADEQGYWVCNTVWMLDDFTSINGAIRVVPGSHLWRKLPREVLSEPTATHPDEVLIAAPAGTVVVMNAHAWHGGTANRTGKDRRALHGFFCRWDKPQQQYQKRLLRPETQARLSAELRELLALDDALNDELSSAMLKPSGFLR